MASYKILVLNKDNSYSFFKEKVPEYKKEIATDADGNDTIVKVPTGNYIMEDYSTDDITDAQDKYKELLSTYFKSQLNCVLDVTEQVSINVDIEDVGDGGVVDFATDDDVDGAIASISAILG